VAYRKKNQVATDARQNTEQLVMAACGTFGDSRHATSSHFGEARQRSGHQPARKNYTQFESSPSRDEMRQRQTGNEREGSEMIEMGLLASRYVVLVTQSISTASFYTQEVGVDGHDAKLVVEEEHRDEYVNYKAGNVTLATHPIMRQFYDRVRF
jgi:hypothetical protein